jgi:hypothetical protein
MPISLSYPDNINLKKFRLIALLLLSPLFFFGQTLTGLWTGSLSNDSTTIRKDQSFEIALTEYKGKVYGYSRSEFIVDDTLYYIVKRVKGTITDDVCEVTDDEIVAYNFRGKLDKGVKVISTFRKNQNDSTWYLDGTWKTNATKKYYAVTGKVGLEEEKDLTASKIFPHLEELGLAKDIAFYQERKELPAIVRIVRPEKIITEYSTKSLPQLNNTDVAVSVSKPELQKAEAKSVPVISIASIITTAEETKPDITVASSVSDIDKTVTEVNEVVARINKPINDLPKTDAREINVGSVSVSPASPNKTIAKANIPEVLTKPISNSNEMVAPQTSVDQTKQETKPVIVKNISIVSPSSVEKPNAIQKTADVKQQVSNVTKSTSSVASAPPKPSIETRKQEIATVTKASSVAVNSSVQEKKEIKTEPVTVVSIKSEEKKPAVDIIAKSSVVAGRKSEFSQIVSFKSDSLELSLYDNGEIDGDTVSVFMNGEVIMSRQGLKASAIKKTIYITPGNEDFALVLFAENLGKYPPNTGLLVVHDGEDVYNLRFSSDFQKSSGIVFRKKK